MSITKEFYKELVSEILSQEKLNPVKLNKIKTQVAKKHNIKTIVKNPQIIAHCKSEQRDKIIEKLNTKPIRKSSGVTIVALFTKPHSCPHGKCIYCPGGPNSVFGDTPQSYTGREPAAQRAIRNHFDPYLQIFNRLEQYVIQGRIPDKIELIFMGGTFPSLNKSYKDEFVKYTYKAVNDFGELFIEEKEKKKIKWEEFIDFFELKNENLKFGSLKRTNHIHKKILNLKRKPI